MALEDLPVIAHGTDRRQRPAVLQRAGEEPRQRGRGGEARGEGVERLVAGARAEHARLLAGLPDRVGAVRFGQL